MVVGRLNPLRGQHFLSWLLTGSLLILTAASLGACLTDLAYRPDVKGAFLDDGWVEELVEGRWWVFGLGALLAYAMRVGFLIRSRQSPRALVWVLPIDLVVVAILAGVTGYGLYELSQWTLSCDSLEWRTHRKCFAHDLW